MYIVKQKIKGKIYVYQVTAYWDKDKQQARQHRICIGKEDPQTGKLIPSKAEQKPRLCRDFGNFYFLKSIADQTGLTSILEQTFPDLWKKILTCAFYEISERKPLYLCEPWSETTKTMDDISITSRQISTLLKSLGQSDKQRMDFFTAWAKSRMEKEYIAFDVTSVSSYSKLIHFLEYGYNRDGENLPQINLVMLFGQSSLLPVFFNVCQGSINDVKTLKNILAYAEYLNLKKINFIMDKGFYSKNNVMEMLKNRVKFTISVPFSNLAIKKLVDRVRKTIVASTNSFIINGDIVYGSKVKQNLFNSTLQAFVYYDEKSHLEQKESLIKRIMNLEQELSGKRLLPVDFKHPYLKFLIIKKSKNKLIISRNDEAINEYLKYKGYMVILSNNKCDAKEILFLYRSKDVVERAFDNMKNELDLKRLRVHSEPAMAGRIFLCFIALILHSWIDKKMKEGDLYKKWTQEEVLYELKKLKIVDLKSNRIILSEISKKQSHLFKIFKIPEPSLT